MSENSGSSVSSRASWSTAHRVVRGAELLECPALARERPQLELGGAERADLRAHLAERVDRLAVAVRLGERLRLRELRLDTRPHVRRHAVLEVLVVDAEPLGEPRDRVGRRPCLARARSG